MAAPDWRTLRVVLNDRAAIYAEYFPASVANLGPEFQERFTDDEAQRLRSTRSPERGRYSVETLVIPRPVSSTKSSAARSIDFGAWNWLRERSSSTTFRVPCPADSCRSPDAVPSGPGYRSGGSQESRQETSRYRLDPVELNGLGPGGESAWLARFRSGWTGSGTFVMRRSGVRLPVRAR